MTTVETPRAFESDEHFIPPFRLRRQMSDMEEAPGKTWFFELEAAVIDADRCIQCGACVAACPSDSIGIGDDDRPELVKMCTGSALCWDFCPRGGLRYESTWQASTEVLPDEDWKITGADPAPGLGQVVSQFAARVRTESRLVSPGAQDGGLVSAVLIAALEAGDIDGALVARVDPETPWRGVPFVAKTPEEIKQSAGSFYNQTMALAGLDLEKAGLYPSSRIALVGTPCEIQGIRALQAHEWRRGVSRVDAVSLTVALLCTKSFDYNKLMLTAIRDERGIDLGNVGKVDVIHGKMIVEDLNGNVLVDESVKDFHGAALKGCDECADFLGRAADLSVGSVGSAPGFSSVLARTEIGQRALERVRGELEIVDIERPDALEKLDKMDKRIAKASLARPLDPTGELFIDFAEHVKNYEGTDRAPVWRGW